MIKLRTNPGNLCVTLAMDAENRNAHDACVAHALMKAIDDVRTQTIDFRDIKARAAEILATEFGISHD